MANYPFRINIQEKDGGRRAYFTSSFATDADTLVSASIMVEKINLMRTSSFVRAATGSHAFSEIEYNHGSRLFSYHNSADARSNAHVSVSYTEPNTGSVVFHDLEVESRGEGLDYYEFYGTKVCSVLGLPEGIPIYTENFKLSDDADLPDNYLSGDVIANGIAIKESFKIAPQGRVKGNLVWDEVFGEGNLQWVSESVSKLRIGYDDQNDNYKIRGDGNTILEGMGEIGTTAGAVGSGSFLHLATADFDMKPGSGKLTIGETNAPIIQIGDGFGITGAAPTLGAGNLGGIYMGSQSTIKMTCGPGDGSDPIAELTPNGFYIELTNTSTFANTATDGDFQLVLRNNTDTSNAFVGIAFQAEAGFNTDRINAAIFAERVDSDASDVNSDLVFAVNNDADDDLFERMRLDTNGNLGIGTDSPGEMLHIASDATSEPIIKIENTNTDATSGKIQFVKNGHDEANDDVLGTIEFRGDDSENTETLYAFIQAKSANITNGSEDGDLEFHVLDAGTDRTMMYMHGSVADTLIYQDLYVTGAEPDNGAIGTYYFRVHNNANHTYLDYGGGNLYFRDDGGTTTMFFENSTRDVGIGTTSPTARLHVADSSANQHLLKVVGAGDTNTALVKFNHSEATLDVGETLLDLDFDDDQSIGSENYYIFFQNQDGQVGSVNSEVVYSTFTGGHISQRPSGSDYSNWKPGMIVKSTGEIINLPNKASGSLSMAWPVVDITTSQKDKAVMGVFTNLSTAPVDREGYTTGSKEPGIGRVNGLDDNAPHISYNAVGEGKILVTDTNGNIETGDYICSSARTGHGEKQDDDLLHNYTVAKATQPIDFSTISVDSELGYKSVVVACTYHCG